MTFNEVMTQAFNSIQWVNLHAYVILIAGALLTARMIYGKR